MKQSSVVVIIYVCLSLTIQPVPAQTGWQWQYPLPQGNSLYDVDCYGGTAIAVGAVSTVIITADGGATWTVTMNTAGLRESLRGVCMIDALTTVAVGEGGTIIRTIDGGSTWTSQTSGTSASLYHVTFASANTGYAVGSGGTILRSADGGISWIPLSSGVTAQLFGVSFADPDTGTAVGSEGTILRTNDAGSSWTAQTSGTASPLYAVQFVTVDTGYAVGNALVIKTDDGGMTWSALAPPASGYAIVDLSFIDADNGFFIGSAGDANPPIFISTPDGGSNWASWSSATVPYPMSAVCRLDLWQGVAIGDLGRIHRTSDGGMTWPLIGGPAPTYFSYCSPLIRRMDVWDIQKGVVVSSENSGLYESRILRTADGGSTWTEVAYSPSPAGGRLLDIAYADETTVYAVGHGRSSLDYGGLVCRSLNGGASWEDVWNSNCWPLNPECVGSLCGIDFGDADHGVAVGNSAWTVIIRSGSVSQVLSGTDVPLSDVSMPNALTAFAVGANGTILRSNDSGDSWLPQVSGVTISLNGVDFSGAEIGTVVGSTGTILRTWDGGDDWSQQNSGTTDNLVGVSFSGPLVGFVVGQSGTVLKTTDGGTTWTAELSPIGGLADVRTFDQNSLTIVGGSWSILAKRGEAPPGLYMKCPGDMTIPAFSGIPSLSLVGFRITNAGGTPSDYFYFVSAMGPATLVDKGNPASISGMTPMLSPGATYYPPEAGLLIPDIRTFGQEFVTYHAFAFQTGLSDICLTTITFEPPVPTLISRFDATAADLGVELAWTIISDQDVAGFRIYRGFEGDASNEDMTSGDLLPSYARTYKDRGVSSGTTYEYTLGVVLEDRSEVRSQTVKVKTKSYEIALHQNNPNPFNPTTTISFTLPETGKVMLSIYDVQGRLVRTLVDGIVGEGYQKCIWVGRDASGSPVGSGVYFYRLTAGDKTLTKKMVLLR